MPKTSAVIPFPRIQLLVAALAERGLIFEVNAFGGVSLRNEQGVTVGSLPDLALLGEPADDVVVSVRWQSRP